MNNIKKTVAVFTLLLFIVVPVAVYAQGGIWEGTNGCNQQGQGPCTFCDAVNVTQNIINYLWEFALVLGGLMVAVGAIFLMSSGGSKQRQQKGKDVLTYAIIGIVIAMLSWTIVNTTIMILTGGSFSSWNDVQCPDEDFLIAAPDPPPPSTGGGGGGGVVDNGGDEGGGLMEACRSSSPECDDGLVCTHAGICKLVDGENCWEEGVGGNDNLCASGICEDLSTEITGINYQCAGGECPISPLTVSHDKWGILNFKDDALDDNVQMNLDAINAEFDRIRNLLAEEHPDVDIFMNSLYRPLSYQQHLYEVNDRHNQCLNNDNSDCDAFCETIADDYNAHGLVGVVAEPSACAPHVRGIAVDLGIFWPGIDGSRDKARRLSIFLNEHDSILAWPDISGDPLHFEIGPNSQPYEGCNENNE